MATVYNPYYNTYSTVTTGSWPFTEGTAAQTTNVTYGPVTTTQALYPQGGYVQWELHPAQQPVLEASQKRAQQALQMQMQAYQEYMRGVYKRAGVDNFYDEAPKALATKALSARDRDELERALPF